MKNIIKYSILYIIFAISTITACPRDKDDSVLAIETEEGLINLLSNCQGPTAISFHMDRCGWCIQMQPIFQELAENEEFCHITFYTVNGPTLKASTHVKDILNKKISGYPTILFMNQGKVIETQIGGASKEVITKKLRALSSTPETVKSKRSRSKAAAA